MPSRPQYALMSGKDKNMVIFVCLTSAITFFDFLIYLYMADYISSAFFPANIDSGMTRLQGLGLRDLADENQPARCGGHTRGGESAGARTRADRARTRSQRRHGTRRDRAVASF